MYLYIYHLPCSLFRELSLTAYTCECISLSLATRFDLNQLVVTLEAENKCQVHVYVLKHSKTLCIPVFDSLF